MGSWALLTLPLFAVLSLLLWQHPTLAILIFWWLKPAFERLPLYILSHALFGDTPTLRQALRCLLYTSRIALTQFRGVIAPGRKYRRQCAALLLPTSLQRRLEGRQSIRCAVLDVYKRQPGRRSTRDVGWTCR